MWYFSAPDKEFAMSSTPEFRKAFVARLKQSCDESKLIPQPGLGRLQPTGR